MIKKQLIQLLEELDDYDCILIGSESGGWANIEEAKKDGSSLLLLPADHPLSDRE